jgi:hypothetical protein
LKISKREREREIGKGGGGFYTPPHIEKSHYSSKTRNVWENPGNSGKSRDSG